MPSKFDWIPYASHSQDWILQNFFLQNTLIVTAIVFITLITIAWINRKEIMKFRIEQKTLIALLLIFAAGFFLRNSFYHHGLHTDGFIYTESARYIFEEGIFVKNCVFGNINECATYEKVLFPPGYPSLTALTYFLTGTNSLNALALSGFLSSLSIILIFFIAKKLFKNKYASLGAALIFALFPLDVVFSNTGNVRATGTFFACLAILLLLFALEKNTRKSWALALTGLSVSIYIHQQYLALIIPFIAGFLLYSKDYKKDIWKTGPGGLILFITQVPIQWWFWSSKWHASGLFAAKAIQPTLASVWFSLFSEQGNHIAKEIFKIPFFAHPLTLLLAAIGFLTAIIKKTDRRAGLFVAAIFLGFTASFVSYGYCTAAICLDVLRFMQPLVIPVSLSAGYAIMLIAEKFKEKQLFAIAIIAALLLATAYYPVELSLFKDKRLSYPNINKVQFNAVQSIPENCTIITGYFLIASSDALPENNRKIISSWHFWETAKERIENETKKSECLYFIETGLPCEKEQELENFLKQFELIERGSFKEGMENATVFELVKK